MGHVLHKISLHFNTFGQCLRLHSVKSRFGTSAVTRRFRGVPAVGIGRTYHASCSFFWM